MPPFLPRKRPSPSAPAHQPPHKRARLADVLDADGLIESPSTRKQRLFSIGGNTDTSSDLSDLDSDDFEDVAVIPQNTASNRILQQTPDQDAEDDEDGVEWEDAANLENDDNTSTGRYPILANGSIELTFRKDDAEVDYSTAAQNIKKGPSKREKLVRINAHQLHVQYLLWHNAIRNSWIGDTKVQNTLVKQLPPQIMKEVEKWKRASGLRPNESHVSGKTERKTKRKDKHTPRHRDWGISSQPMEAGKPDLSHGDPLVHLMRVLTAYWKKRFAITAPGLRKRGYGTKQQLKIEIKSFREEKHDHERHGEKIADLHEFRKIAEKCQGSRDVGAQLFTALLRGLEIEARMVASLQPTGYGWTKAEQMLARNPAHVNNANLKDSDSETPSKIPSKSRTPKGQRGRPAIHRKAVTIDLGSEEESKRKTGEQMDNEDDDDNDSVVDITETLPKQQKPKYDRDLAFPIYWTEVVSPVTDKILPVSPLVLENPVASTPEVLSTFEPRGTKAERARQVIAYVIAHSADGTAKDVTVRYLRKQLWPGKTKGVRFPVEKVPWYDERGKIRAYEEHDWFKGIMSRYNRPHHMRTKVDENEDATDLVPAKPDKKEDAGVDTLQSLKSSAEYVLERFLRREEALRPGAKPVRSFVSGKGDNVKEEPIYRRADVERCLTAESWHKEGRRPKLGQTPMKMVPVRAVTLTRKREAEEHERVTGAKQMQGLYSWDQTEWIIPEPIQNGVIPKNSYGNMDCFVPSMVPRGAVHIALKGTVRICKKLGVDYAEAVTGFEFGNKRAVPVCTGVVVAAENEEIVRHAWKAYHEEQKRKEDQKLEQAVLDTWRKFAIGLRIRERVAEQYGNPTNNNGKSSGSRDSDPILIDEEDSHQPLHDGSIAEEEDDVVGGGFLLPHEDEVGESGDLMIMEDAKDQQPNVVQSPIASHLTPSSSPQSHSYQDGEVSTPGDLETTQQRKGNAHDHNEHDQQHGPSKIKATKDSLTTSETDTDIDTDSEPEQYLPKPTRLRRKAPDQTKLVMKSPKERSRAKKRSKPVDPHSDLPSSHSKGPDKHKSDRVADHSKNETPTRTLRSRNRQGKHVTHKTSPYFESEE